MGDGEIELDGLTPQQAIIATLLWRCDSWEDTENVVQRFGHEAATIREMLVLAVLDHTVTDQDDCKDATELLAHYRRPT